MPWITKRRHTIPIPLWDMNNFIRNLISLEMCYMTDVKIDKCALLLITTCDGIYIYI